MVSRLFALSIPSTIRERIKSEIESTQLQKGTKNESKPINLRYFVHRSIASTLHTMYTLLVSHVTFALNRIEWYQKHPPFKKVAKWNIENSLIISPKSREKTQKVC